MGFMPDSLLLLTWAVGLVLLVACANVAHLILARSATRRREMAIRASLGAGRARLMRQLLTESLVVSVGGTVLGTLLGWVGLRTMVALRPRPLDAIHVARIDLTTLGLSAATAIGAATIFALLGMVQASRQSTHDALKNGSLGAGGARGQGRGRALLVISEMALSAMLLVGATLLVRSVIKLTSANLGFEPRRLYALSVQLTTPQFEADASRMAFSEDLLTRIRAMPQVSAATLANVAPGKLWLSIGRLEVEGETPAPKGSTTFVGVNGVKPNYFSTMGIALREGASFTDTTVRSLQLVVNDGFARKHWPVGGAVGRRVRVAQSDTTAWMTAASTGARERCQDDRRQDGVERADVLYGEQRTRSRAGVPDPDDERRLVARFTAVDGSAAGSETGRHDHPGRADDVELDRGHALRDDAADDLHWTCSAARRCRSLWRHGVRRRTAHARDRNSRRTRRLAGARCGARRGVGRVARRHRCGSRPRRRGVDHARMIESQLYAELELRLDPVSFIVGGVVLIGAALLACIVPTKRALAVDPMTAIRAE